MTYLEQAQGHNHDDLATIGQTDTAGQEPQMASGWACNRVCTYCDITSYCSMEPNHYGSCRCSQGHAF